MRNRILKRVITVIFLLLHTLEIFGANLVVDPNSTYNTKIDESRNGVPIVNISTPNDRGVSINEFKEYNVDEKGQILNNADNVGRSYLGGLINANPNLAPNQAANLIILQVNGSNRSQIEGYLEALSRQKVDVILANENGLYINNSGTINIKNFTATTGKLNLKDGDFVGIDVEKGNVLIGPKGFNGNNTDYVDIIAKTLELRGNIVANNLNIKTGSNDKNSSNTLAIDASELGGMYAGVIKIVSTDKGVGVNSDSFIVSKDKKLEITADGQIKINKVQAKGVDIKGKEYVQKDLTYSDGDISIKADKIKLAGTGMSGNKVSLNGDVENSSNISAKESINVKNLENTGNVSTASSLHINESLNNSGNIQANSKIEVANNLKNNGSVKSLDSISINGNVNNDGEILTNKNFIAKDVISSKTLIAKENISVDNLNNTGAIATEKKLEINGSLENKGKIQAIEDIKISENANNSGSILTNSKFSSKDLRNTNELKANKEISVKNLENTGNILTGDILNVDGSLNNSGSIQANSKIEVANNLKNNGNVKSLDSISINGNVNNDGEILTNKNFIAKDVISSKTLIAKENISVNNLNNTGAVATEKKLNVNGTLLNNGGLISENINLTTLNNTGKIVVKENFNAKDISNTDSIKVGGTLNVDNLKNSKNILASNINIEKSLDNINGAISSVNTKINTNDIKNTNGSIQATKNIEISTTETLNLEGKYLANDSLNIKAKSLENNDILESNGSIKLNLSSDLVNNKKISSKNIDIKAKNIFNNTDSSIGAVKTLTIDAEYLKNEGELLFGEENTNNLKIKNNIENNGLISSIGNLKISAKDIVNNKQIILDSNLNIDVDNITNKGLIYSTGNTDVKFKNKFLNDKADVYTTGDFSAISDNGEFINNVADITSEGNIRIEAKDIKNLSEISGSHKVIGTLAPNESNIDISKLDFEKYNEMATEIVKEYFRKYIVKDNGRIVKYIRYDGRPGEEFIAPSGNGQWTWQEGNYLNTVHLNKVDKIESNYTSEAGNIKSNKNITLVAKNDIENKESNILANKNINIKAQNVKNINLNIPIEVNAEFIRGFEFHENAKNPIKLRKKYVMDGKVLVGEPWDKGDVFVKDKIVTQVGTGKNAKISAGENLNITANEVGNGFISNTISNMGTKVETSAKNVNVENIVLNNKNLELKEFLDTKDFVILPKNDKGLFKINDKIGSTQGFSYFIESNVKFIDKSSYIGADYLFKNLKFTPDKDLKIIGDSIYETKLISKTILEITGQRFLGNYKSDKEQMKAFFDNAISERERLDLKLGVSLSNKQISELKSNIIWYVEENINGQKVLIPKVYLTKDTLNKLKNKNASIEAGQDLVIKANNIQNTGNLFANNISITTDSLINKSLLGANKANIHGNFVNITAKNSVDNIGASIKANEDLIVSAKDISNLSTLRINGNDLDRISTGENLASIEAKNISLDAKNDFQNSGASIKADEDLTITAKNVNIDTVEENRYFHSGDSKNYLTIDNKSNISSNIEGNNININAKNDVDIKGSNIVAKGEANIKADGDVNIVSATDSEYLAHKESRKKKFGRSRSEETINYRTSNVASNVIGDKVNITSGKDVNILGSNVVAQDSGNISAKGNITEAATKDINYSYHQKTKKGFGGLTGKSVTEELHQEINAESNLYVKNKAIIDGDIKVLGSNLVLGDNSIINGKLTTDSNELHSSYSLEEKKKGFSSSIGSGGFSVGYGKSQSKLKEKDLTNAKSNLVLGDNVTLNKGAEITATNFTHGKVTVNNGDVKFGARKDTRDVETSSKSSGVNLSVRIKSEALDRAKQGVDSVNQMKSGDILGGLASATNTVTGIVSGLASNQGTKLPTSAVNKNNSNDDDDDDDDKNNQTNTVGKDNLKAAQANNNFYANIGVNLGFNKSSSKSNSHSESAVVTTIRGKDENSSITYNNVKNVEYVGTQAQDTKFIYNNVENINKTAVELNNSHSSTGKSSGISTGVTIGYGDGTQTEFNAVSISASKSNMNSNGTTYQNGRFVNVDEVHNNTKNMTLSGFNQESGMVTGNIENLTIESKQNTSTTKGSTKGGSLSISANGLPSGSANYSKTNGERRVVDNASTFIIGDGSNLKVGRLENTASAIGTTENGKLSIDEYVGHNLENVDKLKTAGGSVGVSTSGITSIGVNYSDKKQEGITKNTVIGNVEIEKSSGDEINRDLDTMTEITEDRDFKTNINVESQTINYIKNPEKFKEDLQKAKNEIYDIYHAVDSTVNLQGEETRSPIEQLGEVRQAKVIYNLIDSRLQEAENQEDIAKIFEGASEDLGYRVKVIFTDPSNSPQLIGVDENGNTYIKDGTAYVDKNTGIGYILVNTESPANSTKAGVIGTIAEEQSHVIGKKEGRQKVVPDGSEKGLESLGRPTNDYFKKQYSKNDKAIDLKSDGKDYSNVDFGEHVGDKTIENPLELYDKKYTTADERKEVEKILSEEKGEDYLVDWELYNESLERDYRAEINYFVSQAKNRVNKLSEIEKGNFEEVPPKESVFHNFINTKEGIKVVINKSLINTKKVDYDTGKEVVISKSNKIVKDYMNQGTSNNFTYGLNNKPKSDEGKFDKVLHGLVDVGNYISKGTGVTDKTTVLERVNMTFLGYLVSENYDELEKWAGKNNYDAIGYKEYFEYKIYKFNINSYKNLRRNMYK
ncbi:hemagglutinin repeat-containing protein [Fusobacterium pseudoperiodonticum]|uniref:Hemolysin n=1 Tax=Fusobacterium pseudoperiodonticum TaxID=2663009 RepID=A0AAD0AM67_9FUSO|nr:hemagglutinin repeat-containing protein [Fusobacterium pseudoperiodonticum]ATV36110.1 hemolysin [Fusobacterium pseudoperiodonticum]ATV60985.1 hemolysin [Fusobacterium pseudoperiodonticum]